MTIIESFLTGRGGVALGLTLVHSLWQGAIIAGLLGLVLRSIRDKGSDVRYLLSLAAMALMLVVPAGTFMYLYEGLPQVVVERQLGSPTPGVTLVTLTLPASASAGVLPPLLRWVTGIWLVGVAAFSTRLMSSWLIAQRLKVDGTYPAPEPWDDILSRLAHELGVLRPVSLLESEVVDSPMTIGWLKPVILLPSSALMGLSTEQLEAILAHELAHIRRNDYIVNLIQCMVETLLFFHPAVWWVGRVLRDEREHCCDDAAVSVCGDVLTYARALTRLETLRLPEHKLSMNATGGHLLGRVRRLLKKPLREQGPGRWVAGAFAFSAAMTVVAGAEASWAPKGEATDLNALSDLKERKDGAGEAEVYSRTVSEPLKVAAAPFKAQAPEAPAKASLPVAKVSPKAPVVKDTPKALLGEEIDLKGRFGAFDPSLPSEPVDLERLPAVPKVSDVQAPASPFNFVSHGASPEEEAVAEWVAAKVSAEVDAEIAEKVSEKIAAKVDHKIAARMEEALTTHLRVADVVDGDDGDDVHIHVQSSDGEVTRVEINGDASSSEVLSALAASGLELNLEGLELGEELGALATLGLLQPAEGGGYDVDLSNIDTTISTQIAKALFEGEDQGAPRGAGVQGGAGNDPWVAIAYGREYQEDMGELQEEFHEEIEELNEYRTEAEEELQDAQEELMEEYRKEMDELREDFHETLQELREEFEEVQSEAGEWYEEAAEADAEGNYRRAKEIRRELARELNQAQIEMQRGINLVETQYHNHINNLNRALEREQREIDRARAQYESNINREQQRLEQAFQREVMALNQAYEREAKYHSKSKPKSAKSGSCGGEMERDLGAELSAEMAREMESMTREMESATRDLEAMEREMEAAARAVESAEREMQAATRQAEAQAVGGGFAIAEAEEGGQVIVLPDGAAGPTVLLPPGAFRVNETDNSIEIEGMDGAFKMRIQVEGGESLFREQVIAPAVPAVPAAPIAPPVPVLPEAAPRMAVPAAPEVAPRSVEPASETAMAALDTGITTMKADLDRFESEVRSVVSIEIQRILALEIPNLGVDWVGGTEARREAALLRMGQRLGQNLRLRIQDDEVRVLSSQQEIYEWLLESFAREESLLNTMDQVDPSVKDFLGRLSEGLSEMVISAEAEETLSIE